MISIENYREGRQFDNDKSLATFDVRRKESLYIDLRLMVHKNGHHYLSYPTKKRTNYRGETEYVRFYDWGKKRNEEFEHEVLEVLRAQGVIPRR
jgi:hypothetical protein